MVKADKLKGAKLPKDIWDFLDSNYPTLIVKLLHQYVQEVETENRRLVETWEAERDIRSNLELRLEAVEDELTRLKGERVLDRPVNAAANSKLKKERPTPKRYPRFRWHY